MQLGVSRELSRGDDITILTAGITTEEAMRATQVLEARGVGVTHVHVSTLKPFGDPVIEAAIARAQTAVITLENHTIIGGLGSATAEYVADNGIGAKVVRLGLRDTYAHGASQPYLLERYGLDAGALVRAVEGELGTDLGIGTGDLLETRIEPTGEQVNAEAL